MTGALTRVARVTFDSRRLLRPATRYVEPCPPHLLGRDDPCYGGRLFFNFEEGRAGCGNPDCGWSGIPTVADEVISTRCPACESEVEQLVAAPVGVVRVPRNQPCPCGSGLKAKKCGCRGYAV